MTMILKSALVLSTLCTMNTAPMQEREKGGHGHGSRIQQRLMDGTCDGMERRNNVHNENCPNVCDNTGNGTCVRTDGTQSRQHHGGRHN